MINIDFSKDGRIEFDLEISETNFTGVAEVKFGLKIGTLDILIPAEKITEPYYINGKYAVVFQQLDIIRLDESYPCYVEVIMGTKRFIPLEDTIVFKNSDPVISVKLASEEIPIKEPEEPTTVQDQEPQEPQEQVQESKPHETPVNGDLKPSSTKKKNTKKPVVKKQNIGATDLLINPEHVQMEIKESQVKSYRKQAPAKPASKIIIDLPPIQKGMLSKSAKAAYANVEAARKKINEAPVDKKNKYSLFEDTSKLLISLDNLKIHRAEVITKTN